MADGTPPHTTPRRGALAVLGSAALFGTTGTARAILVPDAAGTAVASLRLLVGAAGLVVVAIARGQGRDLATLWRRPAVWAMGAAVAAYQALFFVGTARAGVAVAALIALGCAPFLAGLLGWAMREGAPGWRWAGATAVAVVGLALLVAGNLDGGDALGMLAALGAAGAYAVYTVLGVRLSRSGGDGPTVLAASFSVGALLLVPYVIGASWWLTPAGLGLVLWLGVVTTTLAYVLFGIGLRVLQPGHIATLTLLEPAVATLLGIVVLGEPITALGWVGCLLVLGALALLGVAEGRPGRRPVASALEQEETT
jgi:DME family drug/metabolite transporter